MEIKSTQKYVRTSPRKLRLVADSVKGFSPQSALIKLDFMEKSASQLVGKVIKTAVANAKNNFGLDGSQLIIENILINPGPTLKRGRAVSRGQHHSIKKRTSHITVSLESSGSNSMAKSEKPALPNTKVNTKEESNPKN